MGFGDCIPKWVSSSSCLLTDDGGYCMSSVRTPVREWGFRLDRIVG